MLSNFRYAIVKCQKKYNNNNLKCLLIFLAEMEEQLDECGRRILLGNNTHAKADCCG
jgi:hypothetical protein